MAELQKLTEFSQLFNEINKSLTNYKLKNYYTWHNCSY